ncbi:glycosyltransferase family 2 protein [Uliginosibacterium sp. 31-12]|uniref:glycosyltransferase family 2 protein n=1 Tax=Uliginosibacterium sp. 31-12 TaxID=3062781 RepID=UPI0026E47DD2|nr:glycosyltransferase family 2 protein [Uliginosibacterium sp. 31-12]MDO6388167.1 glycosyltransferase family 2 protein [Uliginosibacterium sp. 31-12]
MLQSFQGLMAMNKATVVIPVLNGGDLLLAVLGMALSQKVDFEYDVLVIDSGSTDLALGYVRDAAGKGRIRLKEIPQKEFGHGKTRNLGVQLSDSEYVAFLTQDALPVDEFWLANLVRPMMDSAEVAGVFGRHYAYPASGPKMRHDLESFMQGFDKGPRVVRIEDRAEYDASLSMRQFMHFYSDNNSCLRKSVWERVPYRDVEYGEDQIWARDIIEAGYAKAYAPDAGVYHSHTYGVRDTFKRAKVDRKFWVKEFGYTSVSSLRAMHNEAKNQYRAERAWYEEQGIDLSPLQSVQLYAKKLANFYGEYRGHLEASADGR